MRLSTRTSLLGCLALLAPISALAVEPEANELAPITVSEQEEQGSEATKIELQREQALTPGGVTLLEAEDLTERNVVSIGDMLRYVPGM
mgnify:FL=1